MMISDQLRIIEFSDIHFGNKRTPTEKTIASLNRLLPSNGFLETVDAMFIPGDVFDRLLTVPEDNVYLVRQWIARLLRLCEKHDIVLRVLEGTPSHDWKQSRQFFEIKDLIGANVDFHYAETLSIEYVEKLGISILYVPDEWNHDNEITLSQVKALMAEQGYEKVDFTLIHGTFTHQMPEHINAPKHDPEEYLALTRYNIFVGHIHKHSLNDRIISAGSSDRLTHNEEEPKGIVDVTVYQDTTFECKFIENETAMLYKSYVCTNMEIDDAFIYLDKRLVTLPEGSYVSIIAAKNDPIFVSLETLRRRWPYLHISSKVDKETVVSHQSVVDLRRDFEPLEIKRDNIEKLITDRLIAMDINSAVKKRAKELMSEHL